MIDLAHLSELVKMGAILPIFFGLWRLDRRLVSIETVLKEGNRHEHHSH